MICSLSVKSKPDFKGRNEKPKVTKIKQINDKRYTESFEKKKRNGT